MSQQNSVSKDIFTVGNEVFTRRLPFLSHEWVFEATKVIQRAKVTDNDFGKIVSGFSLDLVYVITEIPKNIESIYGSQNLVIFVKLDKGNVRGLWTGTKLPNKEVDFKVSSRYETFRRIFENEINPGTAFINREITVEPVARVYRNPRFTARSTIAGNRMLKILKQQLPTVFED